jgi:phosphoribosylaminoimidazole-succinocarboxamide synthase
VTDLIIEGKTKKILRLPDGTVRVLSKDDITAGDGKKHDLIAGKAALSTRTSSNVFELLKACGLPVSFISKDSDSEVSFTAFETRMLLWEVVARREAHGSFLKRFPQIDKGSRFEDIRIEFFLKTSGKKWKDHELPCDDPLAIIRYDGIYLYKPDVPFVNGMFFLRFENDDVYELKSDQNLLAQMALLARQAFLILERAWELLGYKLVDFKLEFGIAPNGELVISDVVDNDSWRLIKDEKYVDKQGYRDGDQLDIVLRKYIEVANASEGFRPYQDSIVTWFRQNYSRIA